ncbi:MarR family winged helix-turn-helix transcriptional regulator [Tepidibacter hydrothermalis]|uniref:HTH-type transcriptional regulator SarZ n=1 Tax=Tepidibacter hydrothermalis TaxID=3036126 RepID=A0ABY8E7L7_9FIRM|nr:MarR family transcriptional regulator [Tepidibacter hydrothermalis]WFD08882.1 MarR family transcriptional regulator [Tepidibacter hydrothermalis]
MKINRYNYGEENNINLKLIVAIRRTLIEDERNLSARLSEYGITLSQFSVLEPLYHLGPMNINSIIEKTLSTSGNMTVVIRNLEKGGYVTKKRDSEDGRVFIVSISQKGYDLIDNIFPEHVKEMRRFFSGLSFEEKKVLLQLLKKVTGYQK